MMIGGCNPMLCPRCGAHAFRPAVWDLLLGNASPSGRLSQAWPFSAGYVHSQASPWFHKRQGDFDEEWYRGGTAQQPGPQGTVQKYSWGPQFGFQFGLSYTNFSLGPGVAHTTLAVGPSGSVNVTARQNRHLFWTIFTC